MGNEEVVLKHHDCIAIVSEDTRMANTKPGRAFDERKKVNIDWSKMVSEELGWILIRRYS